MDFNVLTVEDVSTAHAKRYSSIVKIAPCSRAEMLEAIRRAIEELRSRVVHHNKFHEKRWANSKPHIIYLFVTKNSEINYLDWACRAVWVDTKLDKEFHPSPLKGEWVDENLEVLWHE